MAVRVLSGPAVTGDLTGEVLRRMYAAPSLPWLRVNMVSTVDGAATGESGRSGSIGNAVDKRVFHLLRDAADAIVVGAGTARVEGYAPADKPLVVVSRSGALPHTLKDAPEGAVLLATCSTAPGLVAARSVLGSENVLVLGSQCVDVAALKPVLVARGLCDLLCEGGPQLLGDLLAAGAVDELCSTLVPRVIAGDHPRISTGPGVDIPLSLELLLEDTSTLLARWFVRR